MSRPYYPPALRKKGPNLEPHQVIIRPIITEKAVHLSDRHNTYTFQVNQLATKTEIKEAVESLFRVKVADVRTQNRRGKPRRYRLKTGRTKNWKKAMVAVESEYSIDFGIVPESRPSIAHSNRPSRATKEGPATRVNTPLLLLRDAPDRELTHRLLAAESWLDGLDEPERRSQLARFAGQVEGDLDRLGDHRPTAFRAGWFFSLAPLMRHHPERALLLIARAFERPPGPHHIHLARLARETPPEARASTRALDAVTRKFDEVLAGLLEDLRKFDEVPAGLMEDLPGSPSSRPAADWRPELILTILAALVDKAPNRALGRVGRVFERLHGEDLVDAAELACRAANRAPESAAVLGDSPEALWRRALEGRLSNSNRTAALALALELVAKVRRGGFREIERRLEPLRADDDLVLHRGVLYQLAHNLVRRPPSDPKVADLSLALARAELSQDELALRSLAAAAKSR